MSGGMGQGGKDAFKGRAGRGHTRGREWNSRRAGLVELALLDPDPLGWVSMLGPSFVED